MLILVGLMARHAAHLVIRQPDLLRKLALGTTLAVFGNGGVSHSDRMVRCTAGVVTNAVLANPDASGIESIVVAAHAFGSAPSLVTKPSAIRIAESVRASFNGEILYKE